MADNSDLIAKYSGGSGDNQSEVIQSPNADLINKFSDGTLKAEAPPVPQTKPGSLFVRQGDTSTPIPPNYVPVAAPMNGIQEYRAKDNLENNAPSPTPISQLPIARQAIETGGKIAENYKSSAEMAGQGYTDIARGMSATGVGKVVLGHVGQLLSPVTGAIDEGTQELGKMTGNPEFASRASLVTTSGLPIAKIAHAVEAVMPSTRAIKTIVDAVGKENIPSVIEKLQSNPRLTLADVDPNTQIITQGLAAKPGAPRNALDKFVKERIASQPETVKNIYDEGMGVPVNVKDKIDSLKTALQSKGKDINPVVSSTGPVDVSGIISNIDQKLQPGVNSVISAGEPLPLDDIQKGLGAVRKMLTDDKSVRTDAQSLHNFQSALRSKAEDLLSSANGQDRQLGHAFMNVRNQIVNAIDAAGTNPGAYKQALSGYRDQFAVQDAFKKGQLVTRNRLGNLEDDPSYWQNWVANATPQELEAAKEGARLSVAQQMGSVQNAARKGMNIPDVEFSRDKLKMLFGDKEVDQMYKSLSDEKNIADTNSKLFQNSQTAMRQLGADVTKERPDYEPKFTKTILPIALETGTQYLSGGSVPAVGLGLGLAYPFVRGKMTKIGQGLDRATNMEITNLATATGEAKENLIKALQEHIPRGKLTMKQRLQLALPVAKP